MWEDGYSQERAAWARDGGIGTATAGAGPRRGQRQERRRGQLAKKIRVYELARELGLTNKEALDLCESLGIGVKSHSSSIEDAQADRVRRKADREGLRRQAPPPEPETPKRAARATAAAPAPEPVSVTDEPAAFTVPEPAPRPAAATEPAASAEPAADAPD